MKPFRIDFKFSIEEQASIYVAAETPEIAQAGALEILQRTGGVYGTAEVTSVAEYDPSESQTLPTMN